MNFFNVSNTDLEKRFIHFVAQERRVLHIVLLHIKEIEEGKLYLEKSRSSLYEYLTKNIGYSSSSAQRRIEGARLLKEVPELSSALQEGRVNLSQVCEIARAVKQSGDHVSTEQKMSLLKSIECKSVSETQLIVAQSLDLELKAVEVKRFQKNKSVRLEITLSKEQYEKLLKCRDVEAHKLLGQKSLEFSDVIELLCEQRLKSNSTSSIRNGKNFETSDAKSGIKKLRKGLTRKVRLEIMQKFKVCQHRDPLSQKICGSSFLLQVDHLHPKWAGGNHEDANLRLLCANHNRGKYRKEAGLK